MAADCVFPSGRGAVTWWASQVFPYPQTSAIISAPRATACSYSSSTSIAAPSAITNPPRFLLNGSDAYLGSSALESAFALAKPAIPRGMMAASEPPAMMASAYPCLIARKASPIVCVEVAQAVTTGRHGPQALLRMAILPAAIFDIMVGMKSGETHFAPSLMSFTVSLTWVLKPPIPEPTYTPRRKGSMFPPSSAATSPDSFIACQAAATA